MHHRQVTQDSSLAGLASCPSVPKRCSTPCSATASVDNSLRGQSYRGMQTCKHTLTQYVNNASKAVQCTKSQRCVLWPGSALQDVFLAAGPNDEEESCEEEPVALMLVVLSQDAIEGFHQQVPLLCLVLSLHCPHPGQTLPCWLHCAMHPVCYGYCLAHSNGTNTNELQCTVKLVWDAGC